MQNKTGFGDVAPWQRGYGEHLLPEWQITPALQAGSPCFLHHPHCLQRINRKAMTDSTAVSSTQGQEPGESIKNLDLLSSLCCLLCNSAKGR